MRNPVRRATFAGVLGASVLLLAACGVTTGGSNATQTPAGAQASASASASAVASATVTLQAGTVAVVTDKSHYALSDTINATILNGLDHAIYAADHQTDCTVVSVQEQTSTGWQTVGRCLPGEPDALAAHRRILVDAGAARVGAGGQWRRRVERGHLPHRADLSRQR